MKKLLNTIALFIWAQVVFAQDFPYHYFVHNVPLVSNPSLAAARDKLNFSVASYNLWAGGFKPLNDNVIAFSYDVKRKGKAKTSFDSDVGVGFVFANENIGPFTKNILQLIYAYHIPLTRDLQLSLGVSGMVANMSINVNSLNPLHGDDPRLVRGNNKTISFDGGFGAALINKQYEVSLSVLNLAPSDYRFEDPSIEDIVNFRKYFLSGTYHLELNPKIFISPLITLRNVEKDNFGYDVSGAVRLSSFRFGVGYRSEKTLFLYTRIDFKSFEFTYTSENPMQSNHMVGNGHNFSLGWKISKL